MRIIAGQYKGRKLASPKGETTRPMLDRVREAVFSMLGGQLSGRRVLDLFAGTGSLGLESLSRGAVHCTFLERDARALEALKKNIQALGVSQKSSLLRSDALSWKPSEPYDLFFFDPPYKLLQGHSGMRARTLERFRELFAAREDVEGVIHFPRDLLDASELEGIPDLDVRSYGTSSIALGRKSTGG